MATAGPACGTAGRAAAHTKRAFCAFPWRCLTLAYCERWLTIPSMIAADGKAHAERGGKSRSAHRAVDPLIIKRALQADQFRTKCAGRLGHQVLFARGGGTPSLENREVIEPAGLLQDVEAQI